MSPDQKPTHTPGPWTVKRIDYSKQHDVSFEILADDGLDLVAQTIMRELATEGDIIASDEANCRLIAAAPELYAALKKAFIIPRPWIDGRVTWGEWEAAFDLIEAAIAKADGR